jgi:hypothetical protein
MQHYSRTQYERQFKEWGFAKNVDANTWKAIHCKIEKRRDQGLDSSVYQYGRRLPAAKVDKSCRRQGHLSTIERSRWRETGQDAPATPEGYNICTPRPIVSSFFVNNLPFVQLQDACPGMSK